MAGNRQRQHASKIVSIKRRLNFSSWSFELSIDV